MRTQRPRGARAALLAWVRAHALSLVIVLGLLALAAWLIGVNIARYPAYQDDEGTYVAEAWAVMTHGQLSHYTYWYDHPPFGWIQLGILTRLFGGLVAHPLSVSTARSLMVLPALATTALLYLLGRRLGLRRRFAALAVIMLICSPLGIDSLRSVYLENFALPWMLAAFALAATRHARLWAFVGSGACFAAAVLSKETMLLFFPGLLLLVHQRLDRRTRAFCLTAFLVSFLLVAGTYPLFAALRNELLPGRGHVSLEGAVVWQLVTRQATGSVFDAHSAARQVVDGWLTSDKWLLGLGVGLIPLGLLVRRLRPIALALAVAIVISIHGGYLPDPFDIGLLPFCALIPAGLLDALTGPARRVPSSRVPLSRVRNTIQLARPIAAAAIASALAFAIVPSWARGDHRALTVSTIGPEISAEQWIKRHVSRRDRLIVDDTMYVDLVRAGFLPQYGVVWFQKLGFGTNLDPAIAKHLPHGWREFNYIIDTPQLRDSTYGDPAGYTGVTDAIDHSRVVAAFGRGSQLIQIRKLYGPGIGTDTVKASSSKR